MIQTPLIDDLTYTHESAKHHADHYAKTGEMPSNEVLLDLIHDAYLRIAEMEARMAELVDAPDSKSGSFGSAGSSPAPGTKTRIPAHRPGHCDVCQGWGGAVVSGSEGRPAPSCPACGRGM